MAKTLPPNYLNKKSSWKTIKVLDLAILLYHISKGAEREDVGFEDARETIESLTAALNNTVRLDKTYLESALWSANMMDEAGQFWHPQGLTLDAFIKSIVGTGKFNKKYGLIED